MLTKSIAKFLLIGSGLLCNSVTAAELSFDANFIAHSTDILRVKVTQAKEESFELQGRSFACGVNYDAQVIQEYRVSGTGDQSRLSFSSPFHLMVGEEYFLFYGRPPERGGLTVEYPQEYVAESLKCESRLYDLSLGENDYFVIFDSPSGLLGKWVILSSGFLSHAISGAEERHACIFTDWDCLYVEYDALVNVLREL